VLKLDKIKRLKELGFIFVEATDNKSPEIVAIAAHLRRGVRKKPASDRAVRHERERGEARGGGSYGRKKSRIISTRET